MRVATYNIEWFDHFFTDDNHLHPDDHELGSGRDATTVRERLAHLRTVLGALDADLIGIVEAPNTLKSGNKSTTACLERFAQVIGLRASKAAMGYISPGSQELAVLYDPNAVTVQHDPGGSNRVPAFDQPFEIDSDEDGIREIHQHYRPPFELKVTRSADGLTFHLMLVHLKSKGIFDSVDWVHWQRISERNRRKLFAQCLSVRGRVEEWQDADRGIVVMGDINDGPGMDMTEAQFNRSAVELLMGDIFEPDRLLVTHSGRPEWGRYGWEPASSNFTDQFTHQRVNVLIDHILVSRSLAVGGPAAHRVWNPYSDDGARGESEAVRTALKRASDHFPVTLDLA
jgi:endonuclease/exonuclease/phosphatase family metal-dependent hydrolase